MEVGGFSWRPTPSGKTLGRPRSLENLRSMMLWPSHSSRASITMRLGFCQLSVWFLVFLEGVLFVFCGFLLFGVFLFGWFWWFFSFSFFSYQIFSVYLVPSKHHLSLFRPVHQDLIQLA